MADLKIGEIAQLAGVNTSTIRYYEKIGLLPASRRESGQRRYEAGIVPQIQIIQFAQQIGFSLDEVRVLLYGFEPNTPPSERWEQLSRAKLIEIEALISRAQQMKVFLEKTLNCECVTIEECVTGCNRAE